MMEGSSKEQKIVSNFSWKFFERLLAESISFIVSIIIARILSPENFVPVTIVTIFFSFANVLITSGLNTALIQKKNPSSIDYSTALFSSLIISAALYLVIFFTAPLIARIYSLESLSTMMRVMGLIIPITSIKSIYCAYVSKNMKFKKFFFATLGGTIISGIVGIILALNGFGAWALITQQMVNIFIDTMILIIINRVSFTPTISKDSFKEMFKYSWKITLSSLISTLFIEIKPLAIGVRFPKEEMSYYNKGSTFPSMISSTATATFSAVLFPIMAEYQDDKEVLLRYTRTFIKMTSFIVFPAMIGLLVIAKNFVLVLLTDKWIQCVPYLQIFCVSCMFEMIHIGNCETIKAMGKSGIFLIMEIVKKTLYFIVIGLFILFADNPLVLSLSAIITTLIALVINSIPNRKLIGYSYKKQFSDIFKNLLCSLLMGAIVFAFGYFSPFSPLPTLIIQLLLGIGSYVLICFLVKNKCLFLIKDFVKSYVKKV